MLSEWIESGILVWKGGLRAWIEWLFRFVLCLEIFRWIQCKIVPTVIPNKVLKLTKMLSTVISIAVVVELIVGEQFVSADKVTHMDILIAVVVKM